MFEYGRHLGLAFQVVDDILDFTQTAQQLGKPQVLGKHTGSLYFVPSLARMCVRLASGGSRRVDS